MRRNDERRIPDVKKSLETTCLEVIEEIAVNETADDPESKSNWGLVYEAVHVARSPECIKNHPEWEKRVRKVHRAMNRRPRKPKLADPLERSQAEVQRESDLT